jgi:hypothetical protein
MAYLLRSSRVPSLRGRKPVRGQVAEVKGRIPFRGIVNGALLNRFLGKETTLLEQQV